MKYFTFLHRVEAYKGIIVEAETEEDAVKIVNSYTTEELSLDDCVEDSSETSLDYTDNVLPDDADDPDVEYIPYEEGKVYLEDNE